MMSLSTTITKQIYCINQQPLVQQQIQSVEASSSINCPRCGSINTKFCYYNNYNKCQPRHFCKSCKRHWTKGGTLRNVPIGGGRKYNNKPRRPKIDISNDAATSLQDCPSLTKSNVGIILRDGINNESAPPQNPRTESPLISSTVSSAFNTNTDPLIPPSYPFLNSYGDHTVGNLLEYSSEESNITNPWHGRDTTSSATDLSTYYWSNWINELEIDHVLLDSNDHHLNNIKWDLHGDNYDYDDAQIFKP